MRSIGGAKNLDHAIPTMHGSVDESGIGPRIVTLTSEAHRWTPPGDRRVSASKVFGQAITPIHL
jgi:hypothetical protein